MNINYPSGHVEYSFEMHVDHNEIINCRADDPRIKEINFIKSNPNNPYDFKWRMTVIFLDVSSIEEVDQLGVLIKDNLLNQLSFKLKVRIGDIRLVGHGVTPRESEGGQCHMIMPAGTFHGTASSGGRKLDKFEINDIEKNLFKSKTFHNNSLVSMFSYSMGVEEPVVQFMMLYLILYEIFKTQKSVDEYIMKVAPETIQAPSPYNKGNETIYTKLRNQITHRIDISPDETREGVIGNILGLRNISHMSILLHEAPHIGIIE